MAYRSFGRFEYHFNLTTPASDDPLKDNWFDLTGQESSGFSHAALPAGLAEWQIDPSAIISARDFVPAAPAEPAQPEFGAVQSLYNGFGYLPSAGGWESQETFPRMMVDVNGDDVADIVGFGGAGTYVALADGDGGFGSTFLAYNGFGFAVEAGGWRDDITYPRTIADVNGDGLADLIGFGSAGVYVALGETPASGQELAFGNTILASEGFGAADSAGGWFSNDALPRMIGDVNGDGQADIVGFGGAGVYVSLGQSDGTFGATQFALGDFGRGSGSWTTQSVTPRQLADVNGDGRADIVGFGSDGVYISLGQNDGSFAAASFAFAGFGADAVAGGWADQDTYPRRVGDVNGDRFADIVGFGSAGVYVAAGRGDGTFADTVLVAQAYGASDAAGGWTSDDRLPRMLADIDGDGIDDIVGFGPGNVFGSLGINPNSAPVFTSATTVSVAENQTAAYTAIGAMRTTTL